MDKEVFDWLDLPCGCCNSQLFIELGYRGGDAHRAKKGLKCRIVKCASCGHIYPKPMPIQKDIDAFYKQAENYFAHHDLKGSLRKKTVLLKNLEKILGYKGKILDIGSGRGEMLYAAKSLGWDFVGIEASREFADFAKRTFGVDTKNCTLESAGFQKDSVDVATLGAVIEHIYEPKEILAEINRILKTNGILWIEVPNESSLYNLVGNLYFKLLGKNWVTQLSPTFPPYHVQGFTKSSVKALLWQTGFEVKNLRVYSGRVLLEKTGFRNYIEHCAALFVSKIAGWFNCGTYMKITAVKIRNIH